MKTNGFVKRIDELGRVVIPKDIRKTLGVNNLEEVKMILDGNTVILQKYREDCVFCGSVEEIKTVKGKCVCLNCFTELKKTKI